MTDKFLVSVAVGAFPVPFDFVFDISDVAVDKHLIGIKRNDIAACNETYFDR